LVYHNKGVFLHTLFLENEEQPGEKTLGQCFLVKTKPTCQKSAIFEHFQKWPKNQGDVLARSPSITIIVMNDNEFTKLKNLTFNPFSRNSDGNTFLTFNSDLDPTRIITIKL